MSSQGCQRVREVNDGATAVNEGRRSRGRGKTGWGWRSKRIKEMDIEKRMVERERMSAERHKLTAYTHARAGLEK